MPITKVLGIHLGTHRMTICHPTQAQIMCKGTGRVNERWENQKGQWIVRFLANIPVQLLVPIRKAFPAD
jgi:hypothetical protein